MTNFDEIYEHCKELFNEGREQKTEADIMIIEKNSGWAAMKDGTRVDVNLAVEKQMPMKPTKLHTYRYCPRCDFRLTTRTISLNGEKVIPHCECCGQAIDWSEEDDSNSSY